MLIVVLSAQRRQLLSKKGSWKSSVNIAALNLLFVNRQTMLRGMCAQLTDTGHKGRCPRERESEVALTLSKRRD